MIKVDHGGNSSVSKFFYYYFKVWICKFLNLLILKFQTPSPTVLKFANLKIWLTNFSKNPENFTVKKVEGFTFINQTIQNF